MIANISPADFNLEETLRTLDVAQKVRNIQNKPMMNIDSKEINVSEFQEEAMKLKMDLKAYKKEENPKGTINIVAYNSLTAKNVEKINITKIIKDSKV